MVFADADESIERLSSEKRDLGLNGPVGLRSNERDGQLYGLVGLRSSEPGGRLNELVGLRMWRSKEPDRKLGGLVVSASVVEFVATALLDDSLACKH